VHLIAFSPSILVMAFTFLIYLVRLVALHAFMKLPASLGWGPPRPSSRKWCMASSEDCFHEAAKLLCAEQTGFALSVLAGLPIFVAVCNVAMPYLFASESMDFDEGFSVVAQPTIIDVFTKPWSQLPEVLDLSPAEAKAVQQSTIPAGPWVPGCLWLLLAFLVPVLGPPASMLTNKATLSAIYVAGNPKLQRMVSTPLLSPFMLLFLGAALAAGQAIPAGILICFLCLLASMVAAVVALRRQVLRNRRHWGTSPRQVLLRQAKDLAWPFFIPVLLACAFVALNFLNQMPPNSWMVIIACVEMVWALWDLGQEGFVACWALLKAGFLSCRRLALSSMRAKEPAPPPRQWFATLKDMSAVRLRFQLLLLLLLVFAIPQTSVGVIITIWVVAAVLAAATILLCEGSSAFEEVALSPGFGLLVSAHDLSCAIEATLQPGAKLPSSPHQLEVRRFRGNFLRMEETLAVSYRWQPESITVAESPGGQLVEINMSRWQLEQLLVAMRRTGLRFVWLDRLSVPQPPLKGSLAGLQICLLSRMMTVYTAAGATLVLRSLEAETCRYHQRAWTFQEYSCAHSLLIVDQKHLKGFCEDSGDPQQANQQQQQQQEEEAVAEGGEDLEAGKPSLCALLPEEEETADQMRQLVMGSAHLACPLWVLKKKLGSSPAEGSVPGQGWMDRVLDRIPDLSERVKHFERQVAVKHCQVPADRVRALAPALFNIPTEYHLELVHLVQALAARYPTSAALAAAMALISREGFSSSSSDDGADDRVGLGAEASLGKGNDLSPSAEASGSEIELSSTELRLPFNKL